VGGQVEHRGHEAGIVKPCMEAGLLCRPQMCLPVRFIRHCEALHGGRLALQASNVLACQIHQALWSLAWRQACSAGLKCARLSDSSWAHATALGPGTFFGFASGACALL